MCTLDAFKVDLLRLTDAETVFHYHLDKAYFEAIGAPDVSEGELDTTLTIRKCSDCFELHFHTEGVVCVACDLCLDDMEQPVVADNYLVAKIGNADSESDDTVVVDEQQGTLDTSWFIYEFVDLAIPVRHVHAPGKCNAAMTKLLEEHSTARSSERSDEEPTDPRWEALKRLTIND
ncbi:MAG: DUF177 domain-containing protein [Prevotella sp.]|nr:DUF177 domain-containing protein [Prevotella sp.]